MTSVSAVIPTRNRLESLCRCLASLESQTYSLKEVLVVDASDEPIDEQILAARFGRLHLIVVHSQPSVCAQRNLGISRASGTHILLSDDDIEYPPQYVDILMTFLAGHPDCGAVCGALLERSSRGLEDVTSQTLSMIQLCWRFIFQLTVWVDVESIQTSLPGGIPLRWLKAHYRQRHNTFTLAGWPLVTQVGGDYFRTAVFGLGASVVKRDWLLLSPFDETLDSFGIGDNYGVAINFPGTLPITVVRSASAIHHRSEVNRLTETVAYFRRVLVLHYFMTRSDKFTTTNRVFLVWSLLGNLVTQIVRRDFRRAYATVRASVLISTGRNPYLAGFRSREGLSITPTP